MLSYLRLVVYFYTADFKDTSAIKQHITTTHSNNTDQITSAEIRIILTNNTKIRYKNNKIKNVDTSLKTLVLNFFKSEL